MIDKYTNEEVALCGCGHIENMHYYDYKYEVLNANYHNAMCLSCNNQFKEIHKETKDQLWSYIHYKKWKTIRQIKYMENDEGIMQGSTCGKYKGIST